jgi:hypothetical protein
MWGAKQTLVMESTNDDKGSVMRRVHLAGGCLSIEGHDLGSGVEEFFGHSEYEFRRSLSKAETTALRERLGVPRRDGLLAAIEDRFRTTHELEQFLEEHGLSGTFWSRVGD